jgi:hypothetical protein
MSSRFPSEQLDLRRDAPRLEPASLEVDGPRALLMLYCLNLIHLTVANGSPSMSPVLTTLRTSTSTTR